MTKLKPSFMDPSNSRGGKKKTMKDLSKREIGGYRPCPRPECKDLGYMSHHISDGLVELCPPFESSWHPCCYDQHCPNNSWADQNQQHDESRSFKQQFNYVPNGRTRSFSYAGCVEQDDENSSETRKLNHYRTRTLPSTLSWVSQVDNKPPSPPPIPPRGPNLSSCCSSSPSFHGAPPKCTCEEPIDCEACLHTSPNYQVNSRLCQPAPCCQPVDSRNNLIQYSYIPEDPPSDTFVHSSSKKSSSNTSNNSNCSSSNRMGYDPVTFHHQFQNARNKPMRACSEIESMSSICHSGCISPLMISPTPCTLSNSPCRLCPMQAVSCDNLACTMPGFDNIHCSPFGTPCSEPFDTPCSEPQCSTTSSCPSPPLPSAPGGCEDRCIGVPPTSLQERSHQCSIICARPGSIEAVSMCGDGQVHNVSNGEFFDPSEFNFGSKEGQDLQVILTHFCPPLRFRNRFLPTVPTFAVRETDVSRHNGEPRVPSLNPSETIVLSEHSRLWGV